MVYVAQTRPLAGEPSERVIRWHGGSHIEVCVTENEYDPDLPAAKPAEIPNDFELVAIDEFGPYSGPLRTELFEFILHYERVSADSH